MGEFERGSGLDGPSRDGTTVHAVMQVLWLRRLWFTTPPAPQLYFNGNAHPAVNEPLDWWGRGGLVEDPHWEGGRSRQFPALLVRGGSLSLIVGLRWKPRTPIAGSVEVEPLLNGSHPYKHAFRPTACSFEERGTDTIVVYLTFGGSVPDMVGRFELQLNWNVVPARGSAFRFRVQGQASFATKHVVYFGYGPPLDPSEDEPRPSRRDSLTGTPKRLGKLISLLDTGQQPCGAEHELDELIWKVHSGISDATPPYFSNVHDVHLTHDGTKERRLDSRGQWEGTGTPLPLEDQWLMWVNNAKHWNSASCMGHVQLLKTMLSTVGVLIRRSVVLPVTDVLPPSLPGSPPRRLSLSEIESKYLEGHVAGNAHKRTDTSSRLTAKLLAPGDAEPKEAFVALMEHGRRGEYYEACAVTPSGKYLLGGFSIQRVAAGAAQYVSNRGFASALEVLRWWARSTSDGGRFQRFLCWVALDLQGDLMHCWDRNGTYYPPARYEEIRNNGLDLPVP